MYEYACRKCGHSFEKLVKSMTTTESIDCPKCASKQTDRKFSVFAVGSEGGSKSAPAMPAGCGRCGGPGPCGMN
jgi:putative FmdB family regulatory protein